MDQTLLDTELAPPGAPPDGAPQAEGDVVEGPAGGRPDHARAPRDPPRDDPPRDDPPARAEPPEDQPHHEPPRDDARSRRRRRPPELTPHSRLGRYTIVGRVGQGGIGTVYEAVDHSLDRRVAIKVLRRSNAQRNQRLIREAQAMARLSHPNVVQVYEVVEADGRTFVAMEYIEGQTVGEWSRQDPRPDWRACVEVFIQLGEGLAAAHAQDLVHRDFKPSNAIIDGEGRARVLDFGLARQAGTQDKGLDTTRSATSTADPEPSALSTPMTRTGALLGTPAYMAPEQMFGGKVDECSDQFSFCAALWEVLYGQRPFDGDSIETLTMTLVEERISPVPHDTTVPKSLDRLLRRGLSLRRDDRWPTMDALLVELRRLVAPRSRMWLGAALGGAGLIAVAGAWAYQSYSAQRPPVALAEPDTRCTGAEAQLDGVWDESRRQQVREALEGTAVPNASETWTRVESAFDLYATRWVEAHTATCRATRVTQEQSESDMSLRMGCLHERKMALDELATVLARADAKLVGKAATLAAKLPSLTRCDDVEALRAEQPPPEDPAVASAVQALRERLSEARALGLQGDYDQALPASDEIVREAEALGYGPLMAESRLARGRIYKGHGDNAKAAADLTEAYGLGVEHGHPAVATGAASTLVFVVGYRQAKYDAGLQWSRVALARARSPGSEPENEALALANTATVHKHRGELQLALDAYQRALTIFETHRGPEHLTVARSLGNIGGVLYMQRKPEEALEYFQRAWPILESSLGSAHPELAIWLSNMGNVLSERGEHEQAIEHFERALAIQEQASTPSASLAITVYNIGHSSANQGHADEALAHYRRSLDIFEQALGPEHPQLATPLMSIAQLRLDKGEFDAAEDDFERALEIQQAAHGPDDPQVTGSVVGLAKVALGRGDAETTRTHAGRAIAILGVSDAAPATLASARFVLAQSLWLDGARRKEARSLAEQAEATWMKSGDGYEDELVAVQTWLTEHEL